jgi:hypothetical protein
LCDRNESVHGLVLVLVHDVEAVHGYEYDGEYGYGEKTAVANASFRKGT